MIIATFNVNSVRTRLHILERWLNEINPDMLFMQETKASDALYPKEFFMNLGYHSYYHGEKMYNGISVAIRDTLTDIDVTYGFPNGEYDTRVQTLKHKDMIILNTYVPQGKEITHPDFSVKKEFFARIHEVIERNYNSYFLWLGDMNVAPEAIDVTHPEKKNKHVCFCEEIRRVYADTKRGLTDLHRKFSPEAGIYTFYDYRVHDAVNRGIGWRIDHMLASETLAERVRICYADTRVRTWPRPSDHVPLIMEVN